MGNWDEIPMDVARKIAERIYYYEDFTAFGGVCTRWRHAKATANPPVASLRIPCLMLAEAPHTHTWKRRFYSLFTHKVESHEFPGPTALTLTPSYDLKEEEEEDDDDEEEEEEEEDGEDDEDFEDDLGYLSSKGWLLCVRQVDFSLYLVHPITKQVIRPPPPPHRCNDKGERLDVRWIWKFGLSQDPLLSTNGKDDYTMVVTVMNQNWFWCSKNKDPHKWIVHPNMGVYILEITFFKGHFYGVGDDGEVVVYKRCIDNNNNGYVIDSPKLLTTLPLEYGSYPGMMYILESSGALLVIFRDVEASNRRDNYQTENFRVWEVNAETGEYREVKSIAGNRAIFVGRSSSFSVPAFPPHCKPNCIYYTDDLKECYVDSSFGGGADMGVFDLTSGRKIQDFPSHDCPSTFSHATPPLWVSSSGQQF